VEFFLSQAGEREKAYDWLGAAEFCGKAMGLVPETDFLKLGQVQERISYAFYRGAMQAESVNEFKDRMREALTDYGRAKEFYERMGEPGKTPRTLRCEAMMAYMGYWLASEVPEKRRLLDECWRLTKEALKSFEEAGESLEYGKTYNQMSSTAYHFYALEWSFQAHEGIVREAIVCGERAITLLSNAGDPQELAKAYVETAIYLGILGFTFIPDIEEKEGYYQKGFDFWRKANELSEEAAFLALLDIGDRLEWSIDDTLVHYGKALSWAEKTRDRFLIGSSLDWLAYASFWKGWGTDDPDKKREFYQRALQYAEDARQWFSSISYASSRGGSEWIGAPHVDYYWELALWETDLKKRRGLLEKAVAYGIAAIESAESTGYPNIIMLENHVLSKALVALAQTETNIEEKRRLLEKALPHRNKAIEISEQLAPYAYWNRGVMWNYLADLEAELSRVEKDPENRKNVLEEAISSKERSLQLCIKTQSNWEKEGELLNFAVLGRYQYSYGELLNRFYAISNSYEHQRKATKAFEEAAESFQKLNQVSLIAECHWKVAGGHDALSEHLKAAENFTLASNNYTSAAEKIPQLKNLYQEHALYMQAWSEIERARHHHARQEYRVAKEQYEKAASIHKSLKQWSYLSPNYSAWAQVENAEDLSRRESSEEALQAFMEAAKMFAETKKTLETKLGQIENLDEKTMVTNLTEASDLRHEYCRGRMALEEAKILDKKGDHYASSEKYGSAAETFQKITQALESEQDQKEFKLITTLSRAWQKMTLAEAEESPNLYTEASQLFEEAKELSPNEKARMLASGHSRFCKALEAGTKFSDTGDVAQHTVAQQHLESAAKYYVRAGFQNASEYAKATEQLFDAYVYMDNAKKEPAPEKKAKFYTMAERVLQSSAGSFMKAEHPEKREQVLRMLDKVKEERELALSLSEVLHAPTIVSATTAFSAPTPTHENPVGLERFEHADVQANLITRQKELKVGESLNLEIELVNAGKGPALLTKIAEIIPEGFELTEKPEMYRFEDSYLNMKGKRLDPLKMEEVRLVLKPKVQGVFPLKPTIMYLDENGKYKSHEPEPVTVTVKELGIRGWIKGER